MGLYATVVCMMNFIDSWALRLINSGLPLNYGATRAGGSLSYAFGAVIFGMVVSRWGFRPGNAVLWVLWGLMCVVALSLPNPPAPDRPARTVTLGRGIGTLRHNRVYCVMLAALFLSTLASGSMESFYSVLILSSGGTEQHVGIALFLQAISELPVMFGYTRIRSKTHLSAAALISVSMLCYALKALVLGGASSLGVVMAAGLFQALSFAGDGAGGVSGHRAPAVPGHRPGGRRRGGQRPQRLPGGVPGHGLDVPHRGRAGAAGQRPGALLCKDVE